MWAPRMRRYLTGDALDFYVHMRRVGIDLHRWGPIRNGFLQRFCRDTRDRVLAQLAAIYGEVTMALTPLASPKL